MNNYRLAYEDSDGFGNNFQEDSIGAGITSLPIRQPQPVEQPQPIYQPIAQPVAQPAAQPMPLETDYYAQQFRNDFAPQPAQPVAQPLALPALQPAVEQAPFNSSSGIIEDVENPYNYAPDTNDIPKDSPVGVAAPALQPESAPIGAQPLAQPQADQNTGVFGLPITPDQAPEQAQPAQPAQPAGPDPKTIDSLANQILGQGLTGKWTGAGHGSAEKNAEDMAKILAGIGITDIKQFGKVDKYEPIQKVGMTFNGQPVQGSDSQFYVLDAVDTGDGTDYVRKYLNPEEAAQVKPTYGVLTGTDEYNQPTYTRVDPTNVKEKDGQLFGVTGQTFGNKLTGQEVPNTYTERQTGDFFGGTYEGKGNTGYGVQFDSQGNPIFYTQGASSNTLANLLQDLGPIGQIAIAAATGGLSLPAQLAANAGIQLLAGGNLKDIAKGTALSYLGGQAGNLISGSSGITDLLGKTGTDIAARTAQQFVGSGGKADLEQALLGNALSSGINSTIGDVPGLDNLSPVDRNMTSSLISAIATGTPIDQAIQNAIVGKVSSEARNAVAQARNAPPSSVDQPQTYEDMMAGIEPRTPDQPSTDTGPSNDEILKQIGYEPEPTTVQQEPANLDQLLRSLQPYAEPTLEGRTLPQERTQITQDPSEAQVSFNIDDLLKQLPTDNEKPPVDNLINQAVTDTLVTKNADEPATGKGKTMDEIDYSQIFGDYGVNLADELANAGGSGNASSIFSGDGGIDLSAFTSNAGDEDQAAPPVNIADLLRNVTTGEEGGSELSTRSLTSDGVDESYLSNLSPDELKRYLAMQQEGYKAPEYGVQDLGISQGMIDEFNKNYQPAGGFGSQWQTVGSDRIMINDDGTGIGINTETGNQYALSPRDVQSMVANKMLNTKASGYVGATGGTGSRPGGSKPAASTTAKKTTKPAASGGNNANMIMALMAMMAMMNDRGKGGSGAGSVIPALQANRSQLPYSPSSRPGAGGQNYFSPTTYTAKAAEGGLMGLAGGGMSHLGGYSDGGRLLRGPGDGVSDSIPATIGGKQPARLAEGEFVVPARIVSELGNGSTNAGANKLYDMMDRVQKKRQKTKNVAANTKAHKYLPS